MDAGGFRDFQAAHHLRGLPERLDEIYATVPNDTIVLGDASLPWPDGTEYVKAASESDLMSPQHLNNKSHCVFSFNG